MPRRLPRGPYRNVTLPDGTTAPFYIIPFDKRGVCEGPETRAHLLESLAGEGHSDVLLFSHGWNNDWSVATRRYEDFLEGYLDMRSRLDLPVPDEYRPMLVGVFWPSTWLVLGEDESGPDIAAGDPESEDRQLGEQLALIREMAERLSAEQAERFFALVQRESLNRSEALELASLGRGMLANDDELGVAAPTPEELIEVWAAQEALSRSEGDSGDLDDFGTLPANEDADPQAAGLGDVLEKLDPRKAIRIFSVYEMKDRAGTVGAHGLGPLLRSILDTCDARVHLIGHSFGGKVVLSATCFGDDLPRPVTSMLLLQPAVSHLCFAETVPRSDHPGGYRSALGRVEAPILSTFSKHDRPLTKTFHLAVRRKKDLGEASIAGSGEPPSRFAALGGFGPRGCDERLVDALTPGEGRYRFEPGVEIYGLRGDRTIHGHGDISNESTWWALHNLLVR